MSTDCDRRSDRRDCRDLCDRLCDRSAGAALAVSAVFGP